MSAIPSTKTLDHIVHLTPPGTLEQASQQFRDLGFNVIAGGTHADGLTVNALVILRDGVYLELISFVHPASHYPPSSPSRQRRDTHPWAHSPPGWIDYAFLGTGASDDAGSPASTIVSRIVNARAARDHSGVRYAPETRGGRTRTDDGRTLAWVITAPNDDGLRGMLPFFCGDVTPRSWRVPVAPPSNAEHPSGAEGVAHVRLLARPGALADIAAQLTSVIGEPPRSGLDSARSGHVWTLRAPSASGTGTGAHKPRLVLSAPTNGDERRHLDTNGPGIYEVGFSVSTGRDGEASTPYGKIVWSRSSLA